MNTFTYLAVRSRVTSTRLPPAGSRRTPSGRRRQTRARIARCTYRPSTGETCRSRNAERRARSCSACACACSSRRQPTLCGTPGWSYRIMFCIKRSSSLCVLRASCTCWASYWVAGSRERFAPTDAAGETITAASSRRLCVHTDAWCAPLGARSTPPARSTARAPSPAASRIHHRRPSTYFRRRSYRRHRDTDDGERTRTGLCGHQEYQRNRARSLQSRVAIGSFRMIETPTSHCSSSAGYRCSSPTTHLVLVSQTVFAVGRFQPFFVQTRHKCFLQTIPSIWNTFKYYGNCVCDE